MITDLRVLANALGGEITGGRLRCPGPDHSAADRSLSIKLDNNAPDGFVVHSFAGDDPIVCKDYVRSKAGLPAFKPNGNGKRHRASDDAIERALMAVVAKQTQNDDKPKGKIVATYDYKDADGTLLYQVCRYEPKRFGHRQPDGKGGWIYKGSERRVIYRWPELIKYPDATTFITEGEKDANNVIALDLTATTVASGKWTDDCVNALAGRDCWIIQDIDLNGAGDKKALETAKCLHAVAKSIKIVRLPGLTGDPGNKDVSNWLEQGHSKEELIEICASTLDWSPDDASASDSDAQDEAATEPEAKSDEPAAEQPKEALIQSSGEFVAAYEPPDYLVDGLLQRCFCYSLTAHTGRGKTALALLIAVHVALGRSLAGRDVEQGRVLMFAPENPTDVRQRWIAMSQQMDFDADTIDVNFIPGRFKISALIKRIRAEVAALGGVVTADYRHQRCLLRRRGRKQQCAARPTRLTNARTAAAGRPNDNYQLPPH
jgi:hypothetical protein